jgi:hypothetical protein
MPVVPALACGSPLAAAPEIDPGGNARPRSTWAIPHPIAFVAFGTSKANHSHEKRDSFVTPPFANTWPKPCPEGRG